MKKISLNKTIWTIGHSTRTLAELIEMLHSFQIEMVVDIRSYPGSRRYPQFNKEALEISLPKNDIQYLHLKELGGRRKVNPNSKVFKEGIIELENIALQKPTAYMCSEAVWWRCHRSMVSDYLKVGGWKVMHIMGIGKAEEHPYTAPAKIENGRLTYKEENKE
jgi:uncharacterized protein (DUF488 family)